MIEMSIRLGEGSISWLAGLRSVRRQTILLVLSCFACSSLVGAEVLDTNQCYRARFHQTTEDGILWQRIGEATSGVWLEEGTLLVVDTRYSQVLELSADGEVTLGPTRLTASEESEGRRELEVPTSLRRLDQEVFLLEDRIPSRIVRLGPDLRWEVSIEVEERPLADGTELMAVWDWAPVRSGNGFFAYGDLRGVEGWTSGFLYVGADGYHVLRSQKILDEDTGFQHPARNFYLRNRQYIATVGDVGYILLLDEGGRPGIVEVTTSGELRSLDILPEEFQSVPRLKWRKGLLGREQATEWYKDMEAASMPVGLYSWESRLYLLGKEAAAENGDTAWWLVKLDLDPSENLGDESGDRVLLPTRASHLTVIPGTFWALIEKGRVQGIGDLHIPYMRTSSMVLLAPMDWDLNRRGECIELSP